MIFLKMIQNPFAQKKQNPSPLFVPGQRHAIRQGIPHFRIIQSGFDPPKDFPGKGLEPGLSAILLPEPVLKHLILQRPDRSQKRRIGIGRLDPAEYLDNVFSQ